MPEKNSFIPRLDKTLSNRLHQRLWLRVIAGLVITSLLIGTVFTIMMYRSQVEQLEKELLFEMELESTALESELSRFKNLAVQVTSRSSIRQQLEKYQRGEIELKSLVDFSSPRLADAMRLEPDMLGISRLGTEGQLLVQVGDRIPASLWPQELHAQTVQLGVPQEVDSRQLLVISAPILNRQGDKVGIDLVAFDAHRINEIIQRFVQRRYGSGNIRLATAKPAGVGYFFITGNVFAPATESLISAEVGEALIDIEEHVHRLDDGSNVNIMVHQRLGNSDWVLLFFENANDFFAPARMHAAYVVISVFILTLIGIAVTLFLVRPLAGRISVEADSLRDLLQGREELLGKVQLSEERMQSILDNTTLVVYVKDRAGKYLLINKRFEELFHLSRKEIVGKTDYDIFPKENADAFRTNDLSVLEKAAPLELEEQVPHDDGIHDYISIKFPLKNIAGKVYGVCGISTDITDRKRSELALAKSEERFELAMQASSDGLWDWDLQTNNVYYSPRWKSMLGYEDHELKNQFSTWESLVDPDDKGEHLAIVEECLTGHHEGFSNEFRMRHKDGHWVTILTRAILVSNKAGEPVRIVGTHVDISKRVKAENELKSHRENLQQLVADRTAKLEEITAYNRTLFETSPIGLALSDMEGKLVDVNSSYLRIIGYSEAEAKALSYWDITPRDYEAQEQQQLKSLEETGRYGPYEKEYLHKKGYRVPVRLNGLQIEQDGKQFIWSSVENITELKTNQQRLETIIENLPIVFFSKDIDGNHLLVNRCYEEATGLGRELVIGRTDYEIFPTEVADAIIQRDQSVFAGKTPITFEESVPHPDGTVHDYLSTKVPLLDTQGQVNGLFGLASDITQSNKLQRELSQARDEAEHLARAKSEFLSNMSHEIRTPLNGVLGLARMGEQATSPLKTEELFKKITHSGVHLLQVVNDILDFSRIEAGKLTLETRTIKLPTLVEDAVNLMAKDAADKDLGISVQLAPDLPDWVKGDPLRLRQVLLNLLSNAVKFTKRGEVKLDVAAQQKNLHFRVSDTGIGMSEKQLTQLFKPFEQADSSTTRRFGGTGLGLSISYNLAKMMGGDIQVTSNAGQGSEFLLILPLREAEPADDTAAQVRPACEQRLQGVRVLAAEDVEINRLILEDLLEQEGAFVLFAENGQQTLDLLEEQGVNAFDIVLMDIQMPVMDGYAATRHIQKIASHLPVIGLTAHAMNEERQRCLDSGMLNHVTKPIDIDVLVAAILQHV